MGMMRFANEMSKYDWDFIFLTKYIAQNKIEQKIKSGVNTGDGRYGRKIRYSGIYDSGCGTSGVGCFKGNA